MTFCECCMLRVIGNGERTKFWLHNWGHGILKYVIPIIYNEARDQDITIRQVHQMQSISHLISDNPSVQSTVQGRLQWNRLSGILSSIQARLSQRVEEARARNKE